MPSSKIILVWIQVNLKKILQKHTSEKRFRGNNVTAHDVSEIILFVANTTHPKHIVERKAKALRHRISRLSVGEKSEKIIFDHYCFVFEKNSKGSIPHESNIKVF